MSFAIKRGVGADKSQTSGQECQQKSRIVTQKSRKEFVIIEEDIPLYPIHIILVVRLSSRSRYVVMSSYQGQIYVLMRR